VTVRTDPDLLERDAELLDIGAVLDAAREGRGGMVVVEGAAGAGKSTLVAAARERAAEDGLRVLTAAGSEFEREFAFGAIRQLFEPLLAIADDAERSRLLDGAAAPARWVIRPDGGDDDGARAEAGFAVLNAIYWLAAKVSSDTPLLVAVDDLHWVDEASVRSLGHLARRLGDLPLALVVALRAEEPGAPAALLDEIRSLPETVPVAPRPLSPDAAAKVVRARRPRAGDELCAACHAASGGNPLYLHELLRWLEADGGIDREDARSAVDRASIPSLADRVERRIARVSPDAPRLARAMAVLGDGALDVAAELAGVPEDTAARIARELTTIDVLAGADPFAFAHPLVRRSVYDGLSVTERDALHAGAARVLGARGAPRDAIAVHLVATRPSGSDAVAAALLEAAREASSRAAPETAIRLLRRALDEQAREPFRATLLFELGKVELAVRDLHARTSLREALELETDPYTRARIAATLAEFLSHLGEWAEMLGVLETARRDIPADCTDALVEIEAVRAAALVWTPSLVATFDRELPRFEELAKGDAWAAHALATVIGGSLIYRGEVDRGLPMLDRVARDHVLLGGRGGGAWAGPVLISAYSIVDQHDRAVELAGEMAETGRRAGSLVGMLGGSLFPGLVKARRGELAAAEAEMRTMATVAQENGLSMWLLTTLHVFVDLLLELPQFEDMRQVLQSLEIEDAFLDSLSGATLLEPRGRVRVAMGDHAGGVEDLRRALEVIRALKIGPTFCCSRSELALALPPDQRDEARALAAEELELAERTGLDRVRGFALRAVGLLDGEDEGIEALRASVDLLAGTPARLEHARSLVALGSALRRRKLRVEAREHLAAGAELAHRCGAARLAARAEEELRAAGARPRRLARSGAEALTASELRVAELAAEGRTNVEVAQELFVSAKTVETHLSNTYRKLGLAGQGARARLAEKLAS
jgi:DNA-binding NarL/FixJ family response regulator/tetratricopeptide (TPR) repeat protein